MSQVRKRVRIVLCFEGDENHVDGRHTCDGHMDDGRPSIPSSKLYNTVAVFYREHSIIPNIPRAVPVFITLAWLLTFTEVRQSQWVRPGLDNNVQRG